MRLLSPARNNHEVVASATLEAAMRGSNHMAYLKPQDPGCSNSGATEKLVTHYRCP